MKSTTNNTPHPYISIIVAVSKEWAIGKENRLLWHIPEDLQYFKEVTSGHPIIMGRKTWESIGRALPNRKNIVITSSTSLKIDGVEIYNSLEAAISAAKEHDSNELFIIGGGAIYSQAMEVSNRLYLTVVDQNISDADTFFPKIDLTEWRVLHDKIVPYGRQLLLERY